MELKTGTTEDQEKITVEVIKTKTKLREAYLYCIGDFSIDAMNINIVKEELEAILDTELTEEDFLKIIKENARVYSIYLIAYKPHKHDSYLEINGKKIAEIGMEPKNVIIDNYLFI